MRSLLAGWRVSLLRTRADWPIVAAVWLITLLAAVLLAAGSIYPSAAAEAGLRRALVDAPSADVNSRRATPVLATGGVRPVRRRIRSGHPSSARRVMLRVLQRGRGDGGRGDRGGRPPAGERLPDAMPLGVRRDHPPAIRCAPAVWPLAPRKSSAPCGGAREAGTLGPDAPHGRHSVSGAPARRLHQRAVTNNRSARRFR